jgi:hypothetical protein
MATPTLARIPLSELGSADSRALLLVKAKALLTKQPLPDARVLRDALLQLAIEPLDSKKVDAYKRSKRCATRRLTLGSYTYIAAAIVSTFMVVFSAIKWYQSPSTGPNDPPTMSTIWWAVGAIIALMASGYLLANYTDYRKYITVKADWQRFGLHNVVKQYGSKEMEVESLPDFALERFLLVAQACPTASFHVDALFIDTNVESSEFEKRREAARVQRMMHPDPFLVATLGSEEFYLDVWEEPQFERTI